MIGKYINGIPIYCFTCFQQLVLLLLVSILNRRNLGCSGVSSRWRARGVTGLDDTPTIIEPPNINPRGAHSDPDKDPLDLIIAAFNECYFVGWDATPEEQRVRLINILKHAMNDPMFKDRVVGKANGGHSI